MLFSEQHHHFCFFISFDIHINQSTYDYVKLYYNLIINDKEWEVIFFGLGFWIIFELRPSPQVQKYVLW